MPEDRKQLTVGKLIKLLQGFHEDMPVCGESDTDFFEVIDVVEDVIGKQGGSEAVCVMKGRM